MNSWIQDAMVYHIFPLGLLGAPALNDRLSPPTHRLAGLDDWLEPMASLGMNTILLGPVFESSAHGYDTTDFFTIDRRLGTNEDFARWCALAHQRGFRILLDGVFNHVGRDFWAFRDVLEHGQSSRYCAWFTLDFERPGEYETPFWYEGWNGFFDLVKLNVHHPEVKAHLFHAVQMWFETFAIDGLRLDAADDLDLVFEQELATMCHQLRPDCWMIGEVINGDYRRWANSATLDSVTNYEAYKGLYSSHNDRNYFEIAYSLNRQFGPEGIYRDLWLYNFVDNHDVDRIASRLHDIGHIYPLYALLFTIPGVPSIYYGSEWGVEGRKGSDTDAPLRPALTPASMAQQGVQPDLPATIRHLGKIHSEHPALRRGDYAQVLVEHEQLAFLRMLPEEQLLIVVNAAHHPVSVRLQHPGLHGKRLLDLLNPGVSFELMDDVSSIPIDPCWARICQVI